MTTNLFTQNNKNIGDVIVTNDASSTGIQLKRTLGALPASIDVPLFMSVTSGSKGDGKENFQIDVQFNFACTGGVLVVPTNFTQVSQSLNGVAVGGTLGLGIPTGSTVSLVFQNTGAEIDAAFSTSWNVTIP